MRFILPTFNLPINIWRSAISGGSLNYAAPDVITICNMTPGRRVMISMAVPVVPAAPAFHMEVLLPKLTDIRANWNSQGSDICEIPGGSERFYQVDYVDDIGKGFANEHRLALVAYERNGFTWSDVGFLAAPVPMP